MPRVIRPVPDRDDACFWDAVQAGRLVAHACASCGRLAHPPVPMCPVCGSVDWVERELSGRGTIHSWIVSKHPSQPDDPERLVVLVDLEEGIRFVSNLQEIDAAEVTGGLPVEVLFTKVDGCTLPQFRPASRGPRVGA
ncbi:OB-fold domain-containing protein [Frankia sp. AgB1.9]|uniref:Zn-ribbon domain-containing OB-fold protein n=1 Tax=unclassified Frankia TaxID=2632575 RepID=UPI001933C98B|nr:MULTISPECIES: OB-fold domain-containing protein [unclassified Frankia]MBL7487706.1 OB-fold domain-containing protein [Frankia sp. AgW1.1]MBL7548051.1 OB-fold domain-containing protein [Frankia sp. AgB1.9]MBL7624127.1 OB-fold domain-containing protein [Frankia sp. AgB1.8]